VERWRDTAAPARRDLQRFYSDLAIVALDQPVVDALPEFRSLRMTIVNPSFAPGRERKTVLTRVECRLLASKDVDNLQAGV
jgi:hypothetical protein